MKQSSSIYNMIDKRIDTSTNKQNIIIEGFTMEMFNYSVALTKLQEGQRVARQGWNGKGMFVLIIKGDSIRSAINLTYGTGNESDEGLEVLDAIYMKTADNKLVPWLCSQTDALANDWMVV